MFIASPRRKQAKKKRGKKSRYCDGSCKSGSDIDIDIQAKRERKVSIIYT